MPTNLPLSVIISQVLVHTPVWVWGLLAFICVMGLRLMADNVVTLRRLVIIPIAWCAFSIWGATNAFGAHTGVIAAWAVGVALVVAGNQWLNWPRGVQYLDNGRYAIQGSVWPLVAMLSIFAVRYVSSVMLVLNPALTHDSFFSAALPLVYGLLSGIFLARAVRILRSAPATGRLAAA